MDKEKALEVFSKLGQQHGRADYILGEVHAYFMKSPPTHLEGIKFFDWFMRQYRKYKKLKGDK